MERARNELGRFAKVERSLPPVRAEIAHTPAMPPKDSFQGYMPTELPHALPNVAESTVVKTATVAETVKRDSSKSSDWISVLEERQVKREMQNPQVTFDVPEKEPITWQEHVVYLRERQARLKRLEKSQEYARVEITSPLPIGVVLTSDWHLGSQGTDYELWEKHMNMIKNEPQAYMIPLGNTIDNFIWPGGMWGQMENPDVQMEMVRQFAHDFKGKFLGIVGSRCHEGWSEDKVNINPYEIMFTDEIDKGTPFLSKGGVINLKLKKDGQSEGIDYTFGLVHKARFSSALNPTNPNKRIHDLRWPADIIAIAHNHIAEIDHTTRWEGPFTKEVISLRTGTYKRDDDYSESEGFGKGQIGGQMVVLDPRSKSIIPFLHIADGMRYLQAIRELDKIGG